LRQGGKLAHKTDAVERADVDQLQIETFGRDQLAFHAAAGSDESCVMAALAEFACYGEAGDYVTTGAAGGH
jgi:hypothetical protein